MSVAVVIPARMASTRFHGKPLAPIAGVPLIRHVVERVQAPNVDRVVVATDSIDIADALDGMPCEVFMSTRDHACGTDRIAEVAAALDSEHVLNVQGDQIVPGPSTIASIVGSITANTSVATLYAPLGEEERADDPNVVKVVMGEGNRIVYMSRLPVPYNRADESRLFHQLGIYVFARKCLLDFAELPPCELEIREGIELLRALYYGWRLDGIRLDGRFADVDVPEDVPLAEAFVRDHPLGASMESEAR